MRKALGFLSLLLMPWGTAAPYEVHTVLVFPFENQSRRADLNWISESFAETLSSRLSGPGYYPLGREERNAAYEQLSLPSDTPLTIASEYKVAQILGVDWAILGDFNVQGERLTASARLLNLRQMKLSPPIAASGELTELVDLQTRLAWRLVASYDPNFVVGAEEDFSRKFPPMRLDAFENYIRGILATNQAARIHFFLEADRLNPADHRAALALGREYFNQKDYASSAKWLRKVTEKNPHYLESLFLLGVDEFFLGHYDSSEKAFESISQEIPLNEVINNKGVLEARKDRYREALDDFERAYKGDPTNADFCFNRGVALWNLRRYEGAAGSLNEAVRLNGEDSEAHTFLAVVLGKLGDSARERRQLDWLARHEGGSQLALSSDVLPQPRLEKNFDARAFRLLSLTVHNAQEERMASLPPSEHAAVHVSRGKMLVSEGRLSEAERELSEAASLTPGDSAVHLSLAQILQAEGKHQEAVGEFEIALKLQDNLAGRLGLAQVYISLGQLAQARQQAEAASRIDPGDREAQELLRQMASHEPVAKKEP